MKDNYGREKRITMITDGRTGTNKSKLQIALFKNEMDNLGAVWGSQSLGIPADSRY